MIEKDDINQIFQIGLWKHEDSEFKYKEAKQDVQDYKRQEYSKILVKYCTRCGTYQSFRSYTCYYCKSEDLVCYHREVHFISQSYSMEKEILTKIEREKFVQSLTGKRRIIADQLLNKKLIFQKGYTGILAKDLKISSQTIGKYVRAIAEAIFVQEVGRRF